MSKKQQSQKAEILNRLKLGPATSNQLNKICFRYSARIHELRKDGWVIQTKQVGDNLYLFTLVEDGPKETPAQKQEKRQGQQKELGLDMHPIVNPWREWTESNLMEGYDQAQEFAFGDLDENQRRILLGSLAKTREGLGYLPYVSCKVRPKYRENIDERRAADKGNGQ